MRRRWLRTILLCLCLLGTAIVPAGGAPARRVTLHRGDTSFWTGPYIREASGRRFTYEIDVAERAFRLRVGLDKPEIGDDFIARVYEPGGRQVATFGPGIDLYSAESLHASPRPGRWRVEVEARNVTRSRFRVRAKLEGSEPRTGKGRRIVPPNLQILPPHDASFLMPISNGGQGGEPVFVDTGGAESCHPEEHVEDGAVRCLRFSYGVRNTGNAPMDLHYTGTGLERPLFQTVYRADGTSFERDAGVARFHKTHGHYHHGDAVALQLFRVIDAKRGKLEATSRKRTKGFAHRNELLREWSRFYPTTSMRGFGLLPGWADIYEWDRPGNYIDFGLNGDGRYVVRMWADPVDGILESNERDNVAYTYLEVTGDRVELLEAGRGRSPWDRCKIVVGFGGHPDPPRGPRPRRCPPDSV